MPLKLQAQLRKEKGKSVNKLRRQGFVPGVVYGRGIANISVSVSGGSLEKVFKEAGENTLLELAIEGDQPRQVLIHDVATDPIKGVINHVDFFQVRLDEKIKSAVPLIFVGESAAVKESGGILIKNVQELQIEALPQNLPHNLEVDISAIKTFEDHIRVSNVKVSPGVKILADAGEIVASVIPPRTQAELEALKQEVVESVEQVEGVVKKEQPARGEPQARPGPAPEETEKSQKSENRAPSP